MYVTANGPPLCVCITVEGEWIDGLKSKMKIFNIPRNASTTSLYIHLSLNYHLYSSVFKLSPIFICL